jgi:hypothetical protein
MKEGYLDFDEYIRQGEPSQREKAGYWQTAIGLQAVDGLKVSSYLQNTAYRHMCVRAIGGCRFSLLIYRI